MERDKIKSIISKMGIIMAMILLLNIYMRAVNVDSSGGVKENAPDVYVSNFKMETLDEETIYMDDYKGKKLMLFFYETGCPYCIQGIPEVEALDLDKLDMNVLMVNMTEIESSFDNVEKVKEELDIKNTIVLDRESELTRYFQISGTPSHFFIDEEGKVLGVLPGLMTTEAIEELVQNLDKE